MNNLIVIDDVKNNIYTIRGKQVMLDRDLAKFYKTETKRLNEQVKRNIERFPKEFMFQLTKEEKDELVANCDHLNSLKFSSFLPFVFTEQGVGMLSTVLNSKIAIQVSIQIINAFVSMRRFLSDNNEIFNRLQIIEKKQLESDNNFDKIFQLLENSNPKPDKGVFFEGQLFDAYKFVSDLIREAKVSIKLIDNFIDDRTLSLFTKRRKGVDVVLYTKSLSSSLMQDLKKFNSQYERIEIKEFSLSHDRFLIIDDEVYHIGASLKDVGKRWFGFSKMDNDSLEILKRLR